MRSLAIDSSLEGITGIPLAMLTVPNTASSPLGIGPTEARTLYAIGSTTAGSSISPIANLGAVSNDTNIGATGAQVIRSSDAGLGGLGHRGRDIKGPAIVHIMSAGWPWNLPLAVCGWWDGSSFGSQGYRSTPLIALPSAGGSMNATPRLRLAPTSVATGTTPIASLAYRGVHDLDTRTLILNRLMQRYGRL